MLLDVFFPSVVREILLVAAHEVVRGVFQQVGVPWVVEDADVIVVAEVSRQPDIGVADQQDLVPAPAFFDGVPAKFPHEFVPLAADRIPSRYVADAA